jgi:proline dehydrogenase
MTDRLYPQFATHNAHTVAAVLEMAEGIDKEPSSSSACTAWARRCTTSCWPRR